MAPETAVLIGAGLATCGWLYTARRQRSLSRKQHTINVMLQASLNKEMRDALGAVAPMLRLRQCAPDLPTNEERADLWKAVRLLLNHYEFVAAGLRNGDFYERLVKDSERGTIIAIAATCEQLIFQLRDTRARQSTYEHLEWLRTRWEKKPPGWLQRALEWAIGRPLPARRNKTRD